MAADTAYRIISPLDKVADVQAIPLREPEYPGFVGEAAWGEGDPPLVSVGPPRVFDHDSRMFGPFGGHFYVGLPPAGVNDPPSGPNTEWNEEQALAALALIEGVTFVEG